MRKSLILIVVSCVHDATIYFAGKSNSLLQTPSGKSEKIKKLLSLIIT